MPNKPKTYNWPKSTNVTVLDTPCREYQGLRSREGYGRRWGWFDGLYRRVMVHRWVWEQVNGPVPDGMLVLHRCDNPPCFRYDHLFLGTHVDNCADRVAKGRSSRRGNPKRRP